MNAFNRQAFIRLITGFTIWALGFVLLYGLQALGCAYEWPAHRAILIAAYIAILVPLAWLALRSRKLGGNEETRLSRSALLANRAALVSAVLIFFPVAFANTCV